MNQRNELRPSAELPKSAAGGDVGKGLGTQDPDPALEPGSVESEKEFARRARLIFRDGKWLDGSI
jgi:hypothetical protein